MRFHLLAAVLVAVPFVSFAAPPAGKPLTEEQVATLVRQLGDDDFKTREAASAALKHRPEAALAIQREHRTTTDPEVKGRTAKLLPHTMSPAGAEKRLARLPEYAKARNLDRYIETLVACRQFVTTKHRDQVLALATEMHTDANARAKKEVKFPKLSEHTGFALQDGNKEDYSDTETSLVKYARGGACSRLMLVADQFDHGDYSPSDSILVCNDTVRMPNLIIDRCLVITTGNLTGSRCVDSVLICGGNLNLKLGMINSVVCAGGTVEVFEEWTKTSARFERDATVRAWKLYDATADGAKLQALFGVVAVGEVKAETPFARAGFAAGDVLLAIDGTPVRSVRDAHRLLCRGAVSWGAVEAQILRDGKTRDLVVKLYDW